MLGPRRLWAVIAGPLKVEISRQLFEKTPSLIKTTFRNSIRGRTWVSRTTLILIIDLRIKRAAWDGLVGQGLQTLLFHLSETANRICPGKRAAFILPLDHLNEFKELQGNSSKPDGFRQMALKGLQNRPFCKGRVSSGTKGLAGSTLKLLEQEREGLGSSPGRMGVYGYAGRDRVLVG